MSEVALSRNVIPLSLQSGATPNVSLDRASKMVQVGDLPERPRTLSNHSRRVIVVPLKLMCCPAMITTVVTFIE